MTEPFNKPIITFEFANALGEDVHLKIGTPTCVGDDEWRCPFAFTGVSNARVRWITGVSAAQAVELALRVASDVFSTLDEVQNGTVTWLGGSSFQVMDRLNNAPHPADLDIASSWVQLHQAGKAPSEGNEHFWAYSTLDDIRHSDPDRCWHIILEIQRIDSSDGMIANLAAGPLEDLLTTSGDRVIDRVETQARTDRRFRDMLHLVWKNAMPDSIWDRVQRAAAV
jgi:hypothetical protein